MILSEALPAGWFDLTNKENLLHKRCAKPHQNNADTPHCCPSHGWNNWEWASHKPVTGKREDYRQDPALEIAIAGRIELSQEQPAGKISLQC